MAVVADSSAVNKAFVRQIEAQFIGWAVHWFNLAVKDIITENRSLIDDLKSITAKLSIPLCWAQMRKLTDLAPVKCQEKSALPWKLCLTATLIFENAFQTSKLQKLTHFCFRDCKIMDVWLFDEQNESAGYNICCSSRAESAVLPSAILYQYSNCSISGTQGLNWCEFANSDILKIQLLRVLLESSRWIVTVNSPKGEDCSWISE